MTSWFKAQRSNTEPLRPGSFYSQHGSYEFEFHVWLVIHFCWQCWSKGCEWIFLFGFHWWPKEASLSYHCHPPGALWSFTHQILSSFPESYLSEDIGEGFTSRPNHQSSCSGCPPGRDVDLMPTVRALGNEMIIVSNEGSET